jgi:hypothetical protein
MLRPMAVKGIPPGDAAIVLAFPAAAAAAAMTTINVLLGDTGITLAFVATVAAMAIVGGRDRVHNIVVLLGKSRV